MENSLFDIYLTQFFTTLGQVSAVVVSTTFVVPIYQYYSQSVSANTVSQQTTQTTQTPSEPSSEIEESEIEESELDE
jgi:hypothetical protein